MLVGYLISPEAVVELCKEKSNVVGLTGIHMCKNESLGISDLLGLVPEKEWRNARDK